MTTALQFLCGFAVGYVIAWAAGRAVVWCYRRLTK